MSPGKARLTTKERISLKRKSKFVIAIATTMLALLGVTNFDKKRTLALSAKRLSREDFNRWGYPRLLPEVSTIPV
jgi:hypothetical protein